VQPSSECGGSEKETKVLVVAVVLALAVSVVGVALFARPSRPSSAS
jgi:hypothetical protein